MTVDRASSLNAANLVYFNDKLEIAYERNLIQTGIAVLNELQKSTYPDSTFVKLKKKKVAKTETASDSNWKCQNCFTDIWVQKRSGPNGRHTLCNRCGIRWKRNSHLELPFPPTNKI